MTLASTVFKKSTLKKSKLNALGNKFDLDIKNVNVNLGSSFEQTSEAPHRKCYIPSFKVMGLLILEKILLKRFYNIWA